MNLHEEDGTREGNLLFGDYTYAVSKLALSDVPLLRLQQVTEQLGDKKLSEYERQKIVKIYEKVMVELLSSFTIENASNMSLKSSSAFLEDCANIAVRENEENEANIAVRENEVYFWNGINEDIQFFNEDHGARVRNLISHWRRHLELLHFYLSDLSVERELLFCIQHWLLSPNLSIHWYSKWLMIYKTSTVNRILLTNLSESFPPEQKSLNEDDRRLYENFKMALKRIRTDELSTETSETLYKYLKDIFHLERIFENKGQKRLVLCQKVMLLSTLNLPSLIAEQEHQGNIISEIALFAQHTLIVDCNLHRRDMHGKNVLIAADTIVIYYENTFFDVSGLCGCECKQNMGSLSVNNHEEEDHTGGEWIDGRDKSKTTRTRSVHWCFERQEGDTKEVESGKDGIDGLNGKAGESSGNIAIIAAKIKNEHDLTVRLNGGNGQGGQNGGQGGRGVEGKGVTREELDALCFPYITMFWGDLQKFEKYEPGNGFNPCLTNPRRENAKFFFVNKFKHQTDGREIEFSMAEHTMMGIAKYDLYFFVKGGKGKSPGRGGRRGLGGGGGRCGEFISFCTLTKQPFTEIAVELISGLDGHDGENGPEGLPGKNGNDMVMIDRSDVLNAKQYIGIEAKSKIGLKYHKRDGGMTRLNGFLKYEQRKEKCFVEFTVEDVDCIPAALIDVQHDASSENERAQSQCKQTIVMEQLLDEFQRHKTRNVSVSVQLRFNTDASQANVSGEDTMDEAITILRNRIEDSRNMYYAGNKVNGEHLINQIRAVSDDVSPEYLEEIWRDVFKTHFDLSPVVEQLDQLLDLLSLESRQRIERHWNEKKLILLLDPPTDTRQTDDDGRIVEGELRDVVEAPLSNEWITWNSKEYANTNISPYLDEIQKYYCHSNTVLNALKDIRTALENEDVVATIKADVNWDDKEAVYNYFQSSRSSKNSESNDNQGRRKPLNNPVQSKLEAVKEVVRSKDTLHRHLLDLKNAVEGDRELEDLLSLQPDFNGKVKEVGSDIETLIFIFFHSEKLIKLNDDVRRYFKAETTTLLAGKHQNKGDLCKDFIWEFLSRGISSIGYLHRLADKEDITIEVFVKGCGSSMLRISTINEGKDEVRRLYFTQDGIPQSIQPNTNSQRMKAFITSCCSPGILLPTSESLSEFVHPSEGDLIKFWSLTAEVVLNSSELTRLLTRCFQLSGPFLTHVEIIFVLNCCMDLVCNYGVPLTSMINFVATVAFKNLANWMTKLRMLPETSQETFSQLDQLVDGQMAAILGSRQHEANWCHFSDKLEVLVKFLSDSAVSFNQLEHLSLLELFNLSSEHKTIDFLETERNFGRLAYYIAILRLRDEEGSLVENIIARLMLRGTPILEKTVALLTYLMCSNESTFGLNKELEDVLQCNDEVSSELAQQNRILELRQGESWRAVFPEEARSLEKIGDLSVNNDFTRNDMDRIILMLRKGEEECREEECIKMLNRIDDAIFENKNKKRNIRLRDTQKIAVLCGYLHQRNLVSQVVTGEGKSLIIVALSILYIKLDGKNVDVITSSSVLAKRDAQEYDDIYKAFDIKVDHNCDEDIEIRKHSYAADIVYGDVAHFERDFLLHFYYQKNVLGKRERKSTIAIVDEVDSMLLDHGSNMLYLSHNVTGLEMLEPLYVFIHNFIECNPQGEDTVRSLKAKIKQAVLMDLFGLMTKSDIRNLDLTSEEATYAWKSLIKNGIVNSNGLVLSYSNDALRETAQNLISSCGSTCAQRILALLSVIKERKRSINIPGYLREFAFEHLDDFVDSAIKSRLMKKNDEYVIDVDRTQRSVDLHPVVTIIDKGTGTDLQSSQWTNGLHQFLQLANGCRVTPLSLKAVFISNVTFLKGYGKINGLSGTLGSEEERSCLKELYNADVMRIPTCKPRMFSEDVPIISHTEEEWMRGIYDSVTDKLLARRSVLIICSSINDVDNLRDRLPQLCNDPLLLEAFEGAQVYRRDTDDFHIEKEGLQCGRLIISTNLAGRGTDIKLCEELQRKGGLHVIVGLCTNQRIEDQAFGRAARCGDYGSGQIIALVQDRVVNNIFSLQKHRDLEEQKRLRSLKNYYDYHISIEEECLQHFMEHCKELLKMVHTQDDLSSLPAIKYFALLDSWALELDRLSEQISVCEKTREDVVKREIIQSVEDFLKKIDLDLAGKEPPKWIVRPQPLLHYALMMTDEKTYDEAFNLLHRIAEEFPDFAGEAFYYLGAIVQQNVLQFKEFRRVKNREGWLGNIQDRSEDVQFFILRQLQEVALDALPALSKVNNHARNEAVRYFLMAKADFMRRMEREAQMCATVVQLHGNRSAGGYRAQKQEAIAVWEAFVDTIDRILGKYALNSALKEDGESEEMAIMRRKILTHAGILTPPVLQNIIPRAHLMRIAQKYSVPLTALKNLIYSIQSDNSLPEFEGRRIVDTQLLKRMSLPSAIGFWECLQKAGVFSAEKRYLAIKKGVKQLSPKWEKSDVVLGPLDIRLNNFYSDDFEFYPLNDIPTIENDPSLNSQLYLLMSSGLAHIEIIGTVNPLVVLMDKHLDSFDFITCSILMTEMGLATADAQWILTKLVNKGILEATTYDENDTRFILRRRLDFSMFPQPMQESLWTVFTRNFTYGYALKWLKASVKDLPTRKKICYAIPLAWSPYEELHDDLIASGILVQSRVSSTLTQYKERVVSTKGFILPSYKNCKFVPAWLYQKLEPLSPNLTEQKCTLEKTHSMMNQGITACGTLRNAISNGLSKIAYVDRQKADSWLPAVIYKTVSCLLTTKLRFSSNIRKHFSTIEAKVGTSHYYMEIIKANQKEFAGTNAKLEEEFEQLTICHQEAIDAMSAHYKHSKKLEAAQTTINTRIKKMKTHILDHCLVTDSKEKVSTEVSEMFTECVPECGLLPLLKESIESFMMFTIRENLVDILKTTNDNCDLQLSKFRQLHSVIAFARAVVVDVNKRICCLADSEEPPAKLNPDVIRMEIVEMGRCPDELKNLQMSSEYTLQSVLARELHTLLDGMVASILQSKVQPMVQKMIQSWAEEGAPSLNSNHKDESCTLTDDIEEEQLTMQGRHPYLFRDLYNIFLKITFQEQNPAVVAHMVKYNFPIGAHCAKLITTGIVQLLHQSKSHFEEIKLILKRETETIYSMSCNKITGGTIPCHLELKLEDNCFFSGSDTINHRANLQTSLFEELKEKVPEIAKEYPEEKNFLIDLSKAISQPNKQILDQWKAGEEKWTGAAQLQCAVKL